MYTHDVIRDLFVFTCFLHCRTLVHQMSVRDPLKFVISCLSNCKFLQLDKPDLKFPQKRT